MSTHSTPAPNIELTLTRQPDHHIAVTCNTQLSHTFDLHTLILHEQQGPPQPPADPVTYGKAIYTALFPPNTPAHHALANTPQRILLVTTDPDLDAIPWEYAYGTYGPYGTDDTAGFLVLECPFLRGLPTDQRLAPPALDSGLHIVAIPSDPLSSHLQPLNIDAEWTRLKELIQELPYTIILERTRPPTLERVSLLVANQKNRILHFMGHGALDEKKGAILCFEQDNGTLDPVTAKDFMRQIRGTVFLVTLNACFSATPGATHLSNLAAALVQQKMPYALGMRFSIDDKDALAFSRIFYSYLARGISVEEAVFQARLTLAKKSQHPWVIGVPVLYTSLSAPAAGFTCLAGTPTIKEHQPRMEVSALTRVEGTFQGRINELKQLGTHLTGDTRPRLITIHGGGGQGKTALAREAVERFAHAWPGGIWATSLENLPSRATFVNDLARFLGIQELLDLNAVERQVQAQLSLHRTLITLDNAETLVDAVEANNPAAQELAQFIRQLPSTSVSLFVTSRIQLGWNREVTHELGGLSPTEGATLFRQSASGRADEIQLSLAEPLSTKLEGHPFSLRLLGPAFNASAISLSAFIGEYEACLVQAENKYLHEGHRQRTLYASIETSVRYLSDELRALLSGLWLFHARFLAQIAVAIFDPQYEDSEENPSPIHDRLHTLWQRGLLTRETITVRDGTLQLYHLLPTTRPYVKQHLKQAYVNEALLQHFGVQYAQLASFLYSEIDRSAAAVVIAQQAREDLERAVTYVTGIQQGYYLLHWGQIVQRLGNPQQALTLYQQALPIMREVGDHTGEAVTFHNMAWVYQDTGQPQQALALYKKALPIRREVGDRAGEAATLNNMAAVYDATGQPQQALSLYEQALPIMREVGDRAGEAATLTNMGEVYRVTGQPQQALSLYKQALPIMHEVGNRAGEATTLNNMAAVYDATGQPQQALSLYEQALPIMREVGDRAGEAATLTNMGEVYRVTGQPQQALSLYKQALPITCEVGDRSGEATTLNNIALVYDATGQPQQALSLYKQVLLITCEVGDRAREAGTLANMAVLLYQHLNRAEDAITHLGQAIAVLIETGLPQDAGGHKIEDLQQWLQIMRTGDAPEAQASGPATMPAEQLQQIIGNTVAVMTTVQEHRAEWHKMIAEALQDAQQRGADWQSEVDLFTAILAILDERAPSLGSDHPYAQVLAAIQEGIKDPS